MHMYTVKSSQIKEIGHEPTTNTLAIRFNSGGLYHYTGVDADAFNALHKAPSIGSHFGKSIKGKYEFKKIDEPKKGEK